GGRPPRRPGGGGGRTEAAVGAVPRTAAEDGAPAAGPAPARALQLLRGPRRSLSRRRPARPRIPGRFGAAVLPLAAFADRPAHPGAAPPAPRGAGLGRRPRGVAVPPR